MVRIADLARALLRRAIIKRSPPPQNDDRLRTRLGVTQLEDRTTPTNISVTAIQNAQESGVDGLIRVTRDGDTSGPQSVEFSVSGTADAGEDYEGITTSIVIPAGHTTADIQVVPINNGIANTSNRTVTITLQPGMDYDIGSGPATISITDDVDTLPVTVHQESFQLTGTGSPVNVSLTVTYAAPTAPATPGTYTWSYQVQNPEAPTGTTTWTNFTVPVEQDPDLSDVGSLQGPTGWSGSVGSDTVSWSTASGGLAPGDDPVTFSFTTAPREVGAADVAVSDGTNAADLPTAPAPRLKADVPQVDVSFSAGVQSYQLKLDMTVAGGTAYTTGTQSFNAQSAGDARDFLLTFLRNNGWMVAPAGTTGLTILGKTQTNGTVDGVKTLTWTLTGFQANANNTGRPFFSPTGPVTVTQGGN